MWLDGSLPCGHANKYSADWKLVSRVETWKCAVRLGFCRDGKAHIQIYIGLSGSPPPPLPPPNCVLLSVATKRASFFSSTNEDTGYTPHGVVRVADFDSKGFLCFCCFPFSSAANAVAADQMMRKETQALQLWQDFPLVGKQSQPSPLTLTQAMKENNRARFQRSCSIDPVSTSAQVRGFSSSLAGFLFVLLCAVLSVGYIFWPLSLCFNLFAFFASMQD